MDTKKKELIGNFKNNGCAWKDEPVAVYDHDFPSDAAGKIVPFGIYDTQANLAFVNVGISGDTPAMAVDAIEHWWQAFGQKRYPQTTQLLVLADSGGANSTRSRVWKHRLKKQLCDRHGLTVTVCHYPPGASKWNPIDPPALLPDHQAMGRGAPRQLRDSPALHPHHDDGHRVARRGSAGAPQIRHR